jgi:hypothetical protein
MTKNILLWLLGFVLTASLLAFAAWCSGFDFNYRHPHIAVGVLTGTALSTFIGFAMAALFDQRQ